MGNGPAEWEVYGDAELGADAVTFCMLGMYRVQVHSIEFVRMNAWLSQEVTYIAESRGRPRGRTA